MQQDKKIKLREPVTIGDKVVTELTIHRPKAKHLRGIKIGFDGIEGDVILDLASKLTGELPAVIDELGVEDMMEVFNAVMDFLPSGILPAGKQA